MGRESRECQAVARPAPVALQVLIQKRCLTLRKRHFSLNLSTHCLLNPPQFVETGHCYQTRSQHQPPMDNLTFGLTMLLVGMGGTLLTLWILSILIGWLTRLCQPRPQGGKHE